MRKKILIITSILAVIAITVTAVLIQRGIITPVTISDKDESGKTAQSIYDLKNGCYYVWHNDEEENIANDLNGAVKADIFRLCPEGDNNWKKNTFADRILWFTSDNDMDIPTFYPGDVLLYLSTSDVPYEGISWERFEDYGYTIGVANLTADKSGHYRISNTGDAGYAGYIYPKSDAEELAVYTNVNNIFLDKIGAVRIKDSQISDGGTITGLKKNAVYVCEWYTGTYYQDYKMQANVHAFGSMESFTTYGYEFLHSNCIAITIPDWLKTGYYHLDGIGFFRYLSVKDAEKYNGEPYDPEINWNDPIIVFDEEGKLISDPTSEIE